MELSIRESIEFNCSLLLSEGELIRLIDWIGVATIVDLIGVATIATELPLSICILEGGGICLF